MKKPVEKMTEILNAKQEMIDRIKTFVDTDVVDEVINIVNDYDIDKKPEKTCRSCWNFKQIQPWEVTHYGDFYDPGHCTLGHTVHKHAADMCPDYRSSGYVERKMGGVYESSNSRKEL